MKEPKIVEDLIHIVQTGTDRADVAETVERRIGQWLAAKIARRDEQKSGKLKTRHLVFEINERLERHLYYQGDPASEWIPRVVNRLGQIEKTLGLRPAAEPKSGTIRVEEAAGVPAKESFFHGLPNDRAHSADQYTEWMETAQRKWTELTKATTVAALDEPGTARSVAAKWSRQIDELGSKILTPEPVKDLLRTVAIETAREIGNRVRQKIRELEHR